MSFETVSIRHAKQFYGIPCICESSPRIQCSVLDVLLQEGSESDGKYPGGKSKNYHRLKKPHGLQGKIEASEFPYSPDGKDKARMQLSDVWKVEMKKRRINYSTHSLWI